MIPAERARAIPVEIGTVDITEGKKKLTVPSFSVLREDDDGQIHKCTYSFRLYRVRLIDKRPWHRPSDMLQSAGAGKEGEAGKKDKSLTNEMKDKVKKLLGR